VRTFVPILLGRAIAERTAGGGSPAGMAERVIRAIRSNRFSILSEDVWRDGCDSRLDEIRKGRNPRSRRRLARPAPRRIVWALEQPERLPFSSP